MNHHREKKLAALYPLIGERIFSKMSVTSSNEIILILFSIFEFYFNLLLWHRAIKCMSKKKGATFISSFCAVVFNLPNVSTLYTVPQVVVNPNHKIILLLIQNYNFSTIMNYNANIWNVGYLTYDPWRGHDPQVRNHWFSVLASGVFTLGVTDNQ